LASLIASPVQKQYNQTLYKNSTVTQILVSCSLMMD
jgi:hypothetical protein